jgi:hypothetical protein
LLRAAYTLAMKCGVWMPQQFVSGVLSYEVKEYQDHRVCIRVALHNKSMEIIWLGADRRFREFADTADNPVVMVANPWVLIRWHGETNCIQQHIIDAAKRLANG